MLDNSTPTPKFRRNKQDFVCQHCHTFNQGDGYTNHCHNCLYSLHVDLSPGDRKATCHGLMIPVAIVTKNKKQKVVQVCQKCNYRFYCRLAHNDNIDAISKAINDSLAIL